VGRDVERVALEKAAAKDVGVRPRAVLGDDRRDAERSGAFALERASEERLAVQEGGAARREGGAGEESPAGEG
jgi:hypothetical protein